MARRSSRLITRKRAAQYCGEGKLHAAFSFEFTKSRWRAADFLRAIQRWENALPEDAWPNYVLNNHDVIRTATRFGKGESDERLKVAAALLLTQRGTPYLYYGEEIGMRDIQVRRSEIQDPVGKRFWPFYKGRDGCRAPMQWDGSMNAGFSLKAPWLPPHPDFVTRNVAAQRGDPDSLFQFYRKLIALRKEGAGAAPGDDGAADERPAGGAGVFEAGRGADRAGGAEFQRAGAGGAPQPAAGAGQVEAAALEPQDGAGAGGRPAAAIGAL